MWYRFTTRTTSTVVAETTGSDFDTIVDVWIGALTDDRAEPGFERLEPLACNDDAGSGRQSAVVFTPVAGTTYTIRVGSVLNDDGGNLVFHLRSMPTGSVTPTIAPIPANDLPPGTALTALPFEDRTNTTRASIHSMEPSSPCVPVGGHSVWYRFTAPTSSIVVADPSGSDFDTVLDVWRGSLTADPSEPGFETLEPIACNDDSGSHSQSAVTFTAAAGTTYTIRAASVLNADGGNLVFRLAKG